MGPVGKTSAGLWSRFLLVAPSQVLCFRHCASVVLARIDEAARVNQASRWCGGGRMGLSGEHATAAADRYSTQWISEAHSYPFVVRSAWQAWLRRHGHRSSQRRRRPRSVEIACQPIRGAKAGVIIAITTPAAIALKEAKLKI